MNTFNNKSSHNYSNNSKEKNINIDDDADNFDDDYNSDIEEEEEEEEEDINPMNEDGDEEENMHLEEDGDEEEKEDMDMDLDLEIDPEMLMGGADDEDENEGDEDEDEDDENYLQKFDSELNKNYLVDFHPEAVIHNEDEIKALSVVIRDNRNNVIDDLHKTIPYLTKYEKTRILGQRAKQINSGAKVFVKVPEKVIDGYLIAELELKLKRIPFIVRRPLPSGGCEYWNLKDLEIIDF